MIKNLTVVILLITSLSLFSQERQDSLSTLERQQYDPGDHELLFMPTAYTMQKGKAYFSDYELFFLNLTYAPSSRTHIGTFLLFPIIDTFVETITIGLKQNYYSSEYFSAAFLGAFTPKNRDYAVGNVFSFGRKKASFHMGFIAAGVPDDEVQGIIMLGGRVDLSDKLAGIAEYTNATSTSGSDFYGFLSFGIRFHSQNVAWDLAAVRALTNKSGKLLFLPLLKATYCF
ncbi:MAG: hypothetical protein ACM34K_05460 [Bacillota bacterium]